MVTLKEDDYIQELEIDKGLALWRVELSNNQVVIQDDGRPGQVEHSAWIRLRKYLNENDLYIRRMWLSFRGRIQSASMPSEADGYFFCKSLRTGLGQSRPNFYYLTGWLKDEVLQVQKWSVPELILMTLETRDKDKTGECLICKTGKIEK